MSTRRDRGAKKPRIIRRAFAASTPRSLRVPTRAPPRRSEHPLGDLPPGCARTPRVPRASLRQGSPLANRVQFAYALTRLSRSLQLLPHERRQRELHGVVVDGAIQRLEIVQRDAPTTTASRTPQRTSGAAPTVLLKLRRASASAGACARPAARLDPRGRSTAPRRRPVPPTKAAPRGMRSRSRARRRRAASYDAASWPSRTGSAGDAGARWTNRRSTT